MSPVTFAAPPALSAAPRLSAAPSLHPPAETPAAGPDFAQLLGAAVGQVNQAAHAADGLTTAALLGENVTQAEVFTAVKKADLSLRMLIGVRNKLLEGWQELQRMAV